MKAFVVLVFIAFSQITFGQSTITAVKAMESYNFNAGTFDKLEIGTVISGFEVDIIFEKNIALKPILNDGVRVYISKPEKDLKIGDKISIAVGQNYLPILYKIE